MAGDFTSMISPMLYFLILSTAARWPNFRPNNSKEAPKKYPWPKKIGGCKIAEFRQKWQKRGRKIFLQKPLLFFVFS
jgi:hypothetical protein